MRLAICLLSFISITALQAQKQLSFTDQSYEEQIKTILLYPASEAARANLQPAVVPLFQQNLLLEFDDIQDTKNNYYAKLIHCNYDWTKSSLMDLDFMREYNEITINDYSFSSTSFLPYVHYKLQIPQVKLPGNYLLIVYRDGDKSDLILSKRMMVYSASTSIAQDNQMLGAGTLKATNQQINFTLSYQGLDVINPMQSMHVVIRQNQRWDNARMDVQPSFIREDINEMEYRFFDQDKQFNAGNEFRFVDFRSLNFPGQNTGTLNKGVKPYELYVQAEKSREGLAYAQYADMDGGFAIENTDYQDAEVSGSYIYVNFLLNTKKVDGDVYINGALNNWQRDDYNRMAYNTATSAYEGRMLLKQGWYNYQYWVDSKTLPGTFLEGSHFETENRYEILVYYKSLQPLADMLVGYFSVSVNPR